MEAKYKYLVKELNRLLDGIGKANIKYSPDNLSPIRIIIGFSDVNGKRLKPTLWTWQRLIQSLNREKNWNVEFNVYETDSPVYDYQVTWKELKKLPSSYYEYVEIELWGWDAYYEDAVALIESMISLAEQKQLL